MMIQYDFTASIYNAPARTCLSSRYSHSASQAASSTVQALPR